MKKHLCFFSIHFPFKCRWTWVTSVCFNTNGCWRHWAAFAVTLRPSQTLRLLVCQDCNKSMHRLSRFCAKTSRRSWNESVCRASASARSRKVKKISSLHFHLWKPRPVSVCSSSIRAESCQQIWRVCFCTQSVIYGQTWRRVTRQILSDSASSHSSHMESFGMATPGLAPCGGSLREAQTCRRSLGLIGCWRWNTAGWILLTRAPSSTVTPLIALLKPPPPNEKHSFNLFKITTKSGRRIMAGLNNNKVVRLLILRLCCVFSRWLHLHLFEFWSGKAQNCSLW